MLKIESCSFGCHPDDVFERHPWLARCDPTASDLCRTVTRLIRLQSTSVQLWQCVMHYEHKIWQTPQTVKIRQEWDRRHFVCLHPKHTPWWTDFTLAAGIRISMFECNWVLFLLFQVCSASHRWKIGQWSSLVGDDCTYTSHLLLLK